MLGTVKAHYNKWAARTNRRDLLSRIHAKLPDDALRIVARGKKEDGPDGD